ncbi:MAG TPA: hypothetical protein VGR81_12925 [Candidatus Acidoferrales bacterium]|nr:hypothetical protein [Candidatus Acidoferrales bacterium]
MKHGLQLARLYGINVRSAHSHGKGVWYWNLRNFPGAYFDANGVVVFQTEQEYRSCPNLTVYDNNTQVFYGGIRNLPGYTELTPPPTAL